jgi:integrase
MGGQAEGKARRRKVGSIESRGEDRRGRERWRLVVSDRDDKGKRIKRTKVFIGRERDAEKALALFIAEVDAGKVVKSSGMTLEKWAECWDREHIEGLAEKTAAVYRMMLRLRILPALGSVTLKQINKQRIEAFYRGLAKPKGARKDNKEGGLSSSTLAKCHRVLSGLLAAAVDQELIPYNPASKAKAPREEREEARYYDGATIALLLQALQGKPARFRAIVLLAMTTGLRRGEILALTWDDVDFDAKTIAVRRAAVTTTGKGQHLKPTKTQRSVRKVGMPAQLVEALQAYASEQDCWREQNGSKWEGGAGHVFTLNTGKWLRADYVTREFRAFVTKAGLPALNFHGLRHTAASLLIAGGVDIVAVSGLLGHARASTTLDIYAHLMEDNLRKGAAAMEAALGESGSEEADKSAS